MRLWQIDSVIQQVNGLLFMKLILTTSGKQACDIFLPLQHHAQLSVKV
jgi:hypothetical protein